MKRELRTKSVGTKVSEAELRVLESRAERAGLTLSEWVRDVLLGSSVETGTADRSFTGQDQDVVSGTGGTGVYDFLYRKHDPSAGRWLSPDPAGWAAVDLSDPQTLNRYAYVMNSPLSLVDQLGLCPQLYAIYHQVSSTTWVYSGVSFTSDNGLPCVAPHPGCIYMMNAEQNQYLGTVCQGNSGQQGGSQNTGGGGGAPSNDSGMAYDIFHCPSCVNTWKQSNCVVNKPFTTAADDLKWATAGAVFVGASGSMHSGVLGMLQGAVEQVGADVMAVGALGGIAFHSIVNTATSLVTGCKSE